MHSVHAALSRSVVSGSNENVTLHYDNAKKDVHASAVFSFGAYVTQCNLYLSLHFQSIQSFACLWFTEFLEALKCTVSFSLLALI